jgi:hypothetical protein
MTGSSGSGGGAVQWWYERIDQHYKSMLKSLGPDESILVEAILADGSRLTVSSFRYHGPDMALIDGQDAYGRRATLCAQLESVQVLFTIVKSAGAAPSPKPGARA